MRQKPAFALTAVLIMGLGIGANTAIFTVIRSVLWKPLSYRDPDNLINISGSGATPTRFEQIKAGAQTITEAGAYTGQETLTLLGAAEPEVIKGVRVSANFLSILGVDPVVGRSFLPAEDVPGSAPVVMISLDLWERRFAADPQIAGHTLHLATGPVPIIGVLPAHFQFPFPATDVWMTQPSEWPAVPPKSRVLSPFLTVFGRLKPGVSLPQASAEMAVIRRQYAAVHPTMLDAKAKAPDQATPLKDRLVASVRSMLWMLFGAVGFVLLIACANLASLLLARATSRAKEFALRSALGAARTRLIRQVLAESLLLSIAGGALGILLADGSLRWIRSFSSLELPRAEEVHLDGTVLIFTVTLSLLTGVLFGLVPAFGASRPDLMGVLRASGEAARMGESQRVLGLFSARSVLVVGQVALSIVLLIGAALLIQSVAQLRAVDIGFNPANLLTLRISLPLSRYDTDRKRTVFYEEIVQRVEALPGIRSGVAASFLPMMPVAGTPVQDAAQPPLKLNERPIENIVTVTPGYFRTLGVSLKRGRDFSDQDTEDSQRVTVIDENLARQFWPDYPGGPDPIGQRLLIGGVNPKPAEIIGVVTHVSQSLDDVAWAGTVYVSFAQNTPQSALLAIRAEGDPLRFVSAVRAQVLTVDRDQPISAVKTMDDLVDEEVGQRRWMAVLLGSFAGSALLLALIGIYGVTLYSVVQRTQEIGIRRALGARHSDILRLVLGHGFVLALAGIGVGVAGAYFLTGAMKTLLFHVNAANPVTFASVSFLFAVVALLASYIPARRATRIDPMEALRVG